MSSHNSVPSGPITKESLKQYVPEDPIIIEAGAHIGRDTVKMAQIWPHGIIYAFEPIPELYNKLLENSEKYKNIRCQNLALSNTNGNVEIFASSGKSNAASSLLAPKTYVTENPEVQFSSLTVQAKTLDRWAHENSIEKVDFLWLDMQGYEMAMLKASPQILKTVGVIHTEVNLTERYANTRLYPEFRFWLENQGFKLVQEHIFKPTWGNALFVRI